MIRATLFLVSQMCSFLLFSQSAQMALTDLIAERSQPVRQIELVEAAPSSVTPIPFFKTHVVVFFFASTCPYCHKQAPVLTRWANTYGARVDARSFDDKALPGMDGTHPVTKDLVDVAFAGRSIEYPALFIMNETNGTLYPVSLGALNDAELQARMDTLIPKIMQHEQGYRS